MKGRIYAFIYKRTRRPAELHGSSCNSYCINKSQSSYRDLLARLIGDDTSYRGLLLEFIAVDGIQSYLYITSTYAFILGLPYIYGFVGLLDSTHSSFSISLRLTVLAEPVASENL
jgi:hypothetical protein